MGELDFDLLSMGRVSMDLFAQDVGAPFEAITGFATSVGGTPTNVAVGAARLGLRVALLTAVADDGVGRFVRRYLRDEGIETRYIVEKPGTRTGLALLGIEPPDRFPLTFYRQDPADIHLSIDDVLAAPVARSRALLLSGTALSRGTCRDATFFAAEQARAHGVTTFLDLDLRPDQWSHPLAFGVSVRLLLSRVDVVIGTEEEFRAALAPAADVAPLADAAPLPDAIGALLAQPTGPQAALLKRGAAGVTVLTRDAPPQDVPGFPVTVLNTVGAGDAFAAGVIFGRSQHRSWPECARLGNAAGALVVTRHGCAAAMPTWEEVRGVLGGRG